jgi:hypothetical protein
MTITRNKPEEQQSDNDGLVEYRELPWGDLIYGTKEALQAIGIGFGLAFPGEVSGPKRELTTTDPRGFKCNITDGTHRSDGAYCASIKFPDREPPEVLGGWKHFAPGVQRKAQIWTDDFVGTANDLVAAGLVPEGFFPGHPGMRKTAVTILPDGSIPQGVATTNPNQRRDRCKPGVKCVTKASKNHYCVSLRINDELGELRSKAEVEARDDWVKQMDSLPRPPRLDGKPSERTKKSSLPNWQPNTVEEWKRHQTTFFDVLRATVEDRPCLEEWNSLFKYDAASRMRILAKIDELNRAIQCGVVLSKSVVEQSPDGNVINIHRKSPTNQDGSWI